MNHENVNQFIGLCTDAPHISIAMVYCNRRAIWVIRQYRINVLILLLLLLLLSYSHTSRRLRLRASTVGRSSLLFRHLYVPALFILSLFCVRFISPPLNSIMSECAVLATCRSPSAPLFYFMRTFQNL